MNYVEVQNLKKSYVYAGKKIEAVKGISFSIRKGEIFGLLGPNGAGKTTTIDILSGTLTKDSGSVEIFGKEPEKEHEYVRNRMNTATAKYPLSDILTVHENLRVYAKLFNVNNSESIIKKLLTDFEITHLRDKRVGKLSSGEQTRATLCKALINSPQLLLLDECTVGLDPDIAEKTRAMIKEYHAKHKPAILFTSHYMFEVEELCSRIAFMGEGQIIHVGSAENLKSLIKKHFVEMTVLEGIASLKDFFNEKSIETIFIGDNTVRFEVDAKNEQLYKLLNSLFRKGIKISNLQIQRPTLNDIFIKIARGKLEGLPNNHKVKIIR